MVTYITTINKGVKNNQKYFFRSPGFLIMKEGVSKKAAKYHVFASKYFNDKKGSIENMQLSAIHNIWRVTNRKSLCLKKFLSTPFAYKKANVTKPIRIIISGSDAIVRVNPGLISLSIEKGKLTSSRLKSIEKLMSAKNNPKANTGNAIRKGLSK